MSNPSPPVIQLGASIAVATTTELGTLDPSHLGLGTQVMVTSDGSIWLLSKSTATVGAGVVAVSGVTGWRWIEQGGTTGFVTLAQLADTTVTSGATLVGVNANGGMFSQPDLQHVLQSDVVLKTNLAAQDGSGGASLVGIQDTGGFFASTTVEGALQELGPGSRTIAMTTGQKFEVDLADAGTNTASLTKLTVHTTSGTAAAGFGSTDKNQLENASGTTKDATAFVHKWKTATNAAEDGAIDVQAMVGGTLTTLATFNGKNASGNFPLELPTSNADTAVMVLSQNGDQEIHKTTGGNLNLRNARNATGAAVKLFLAANPAIQCIQSAGGYPDTCIGPGVVLGAADTGGYLYGPTMNTAGPPSGPPAARTGFAAQFYNTADHKFYVYDTVSSAWRSIVTV